MTVLEEELCDETLFSCSSTVTSIESIQCAPSRTESLESLPQENKENAQERIEPIINDIHSDKMEEICSEVRPEAHPALYTIKEEIEELEQEDVSDIESDDDVVINVTGDDDTDDETTPPKRISKKNIWKFVILLSVFFIFVNQAGLYYSFTVYFPELVTAFNTSRSQISWVGSFNSAAFLLSSPVSCYVIRRWGCRVAVILGSVVCSVGFALSGLARSFNTLFLSHGLIVGLGFSLIYAGPLIALAEHFPRKLRLATTFAITGTGTGTFMYLPGVQFLIKKYGWRIAYLCTAGLAIQTCIFGSLLLPKPKRKEDEDFDKDVFDDLPTKKLMSWGGLTPLHQGSLWSLNQSQHHTSRSVSIINLNDADVNLSNTHCQKHSMVDIIESIRRDTSPACNTPTLTDDNNEEKIKLMCKTLDLQQEDKTNNKPEEIQINIINCEEKTKFRVICDSVLEYIKLMLLRLKTEISTSTITEYAKDIRFWCLSLAGFMNILGTTVFMMLLKDFINNIGLSEGLTFSMSALGLGDASGRFLGGLVNSIHKVDTIFYYATVQLVLAVILVCSLFVDTSFKLTVICAIFGFFFGTLNALLPQTPAAVYGVEKMSDVLGYVLFFCGLSCIAGPPAVVTMVDLTGNYVAAFSIASGILALGAAFSYICYGVNRCKCYQNRQLDT